MLKKVLFIGALAAASFLSVQFGGRNTSVGPSMTWACPQQDTCIKDPEHPCCDSTGGT